MTPIIDRRQLIVAGALGLGALAIPGTTAAQALFAATGFTHNVASGEPRPHSILLWTRYVPSGAGEARVRVELSETPDFVRIAGGGEVVTGPWHDHIAKITVGGLKPGTQYHYRFVAADGTRSPVGRTRTLPESARRLKIAVFSCSNMGFGWFGAYAHAAASDCDLAYHLGDYFYEHAAGTYPVKAEMVPGRDIAPTHEAVSLADYRLRYASYRADADLQALHAAMPMLAIMDDHETANNSWAGGAQNHQPNEGDWSVRKAASIQAWHEWMPVSEQPWDSYDIAGLATLYRTDTRLAARSQGPEVTAEMRRDPSALRAFAHGAWRDPARTMMGSDQELWLASAMAASSRAGRPWQVVGVGTNMGFQKTPLAVLDWVSGIPDWARGGFRDRVEMGRAGLPQELDNWGGYPAARSRFLAAVQGLESDTIVVSGDSHNAWAYELGEGGRQAAVEFGVQAVTAGGIESATRGVSPDLIVRTLVAGNPELKWADTAARGYMQLTLTPRRAVNEWLLWDSVAVRSPRPTRSATASVTRGRRAISV